MASLVDNNISDHTTIQHLNRHPTCPNTAFRHFYTQTYPSMVSVACRYVDHKCQAEEVVQEAFLKLWGRWDDIENHRSYLRMTVVNLCRDELRRRRIERDRQPKLVKPIGDVDRESDYLGDVLARLKESRRRALVLRYYGGRTVNEVADSMDVPIGTAKSLLHRGLSDARATLCA